MLPAAAWLACFAAPRPHRGWPVEPPPPHGAEVEVWPLPPPEIERLLGRDRPRIVAHEEIGEGVTGSLRVTLHFPSLDRDIDFKWRVVPEGDADGWNNAPRKEIAAYAVQKWFLDPEEYVVPTTGLRCFALEEYRAIDPGAEPTFADTRCVLGTEAVWLRNVETPERIYDPERFARDAIYAEHLSNFNLLTYLIAHRDTHRGNVLVTRDERRRRFFSVDNGLAFGGWLYNFFIPNWETIRVPALPRRAVERLRGLGPEELLDLATVAEMHLGPDGVLRPAPRGTPLDPARGARRRGDVLQLGLTDEEIEDVAERLEDLLERVGDGDLALF